MSATHKDKAMVSKPRWRLGLPAPGSEAGKQMGESQEAAQAMCTDTQEALFFGKDTCSLQWINWMLGFQEFMLSGDCLAEMQLGVHMR